MSDATPQLRSHLPIGSFPAIGDLPAGQAAMRQRIRELEELCAEVYEEAVVMGLPSHMLAKLWKVAAHGNAPQGFALGWPDAAPPIDIPLIHRPGVLPIARADLPELPERKTVLVVDDDQAMLDLILKILEIENYEVLHADSGEAALAQCEHETGLPDLLITDLMMPGMSGIDTLRRLRETRSTSDLPVIMVTAYGDDERRQTARKYGAAEFVTKPVDFDLLKQQLQQLRMAS